MSPSSNAKCIKNQKINPRITCLAFSLAVFASIVTADLLFLVRIPSILELVRNNIHRHRDHHHYHDRKYAGNMTKVSICDDFRPGIPPPDTNVTVTLCVDRNGCCNFTTVQAAVDVVANFSVKRRINSGIYYEKVTVPLTKPNITFQGQGYTRTAIAWNDTANSTHGVYSGTVQVFENNFINVAPIPSPGDMGAQAVAIRIIGDQSSFWGCGFFGAQDTLHDKQGRHYFRDCFIQGSIDFIFDNARSLYEVDRMTLRFYAKLGTFSEALVPETIGLVHPELQVNLDGQPRCSGVKFIDGAITAHGRASNDENMGFAFVNCSIGGTGRIWLGRAWRPFSRVIFAYASMTEIIAPEGWNDFNDPSRDQTIFYGEYNCIGAGSNMKLRVHLDRGVARKQTELKCRLCP